MSLTIILSIAFTYLKILSMFGIVLSLIIVLVKDQLVPLLLKTYKNEKTSLIILIALIIPLINLCILPFVFHYIKIKENSVN